MTTDGTNYFTNPEQYYKIVRTCNSTANQWEVWDKSGNYYLFGGNPDAQQYLPNKQYYRWDLSAFQDSNNNAATIMYSQDIASNSSYSWVRSSLSRYADLWI